jgi:hypothetical protein
MRRLGDWHSDICGVPPFSGRRRNATAMER